ncbi:putative 2OG-Fe(II) oxygenase [Allosphingosinicella sp.]|uniref:putative 2OG-Fe(II) oxygenase n=1 Tax=Allosphingosinicella sp. TaxID=2823234 RepID=UPI002FC0EA84
MSGSVTIRPAATALDPDAAANLGLAALKDGTEAQVLLRVEAAARAFPRHPRLWQVMGLLYRALDRLEPATAAFRHAASLAPNDALIAHGLAQAAFEAGLPATRLFDRALRLDPTKGNVLLGRSAALLAEAGPDTVALDVEAAVEAHPGWLPGHAFLARLYWLVGDRDGFTRGYERALATAPRDIRLWRELISKLMHAEQFGKALDAIARGRAAVGPHPVFDINEAICLDEIGDVAAADRLFSALTIDHILLAVRHVRHLLRSRRPEEAAAVAERWTEGPEAELMWPYVSLAWRMRDDKRWTWLEGDPRLIGQFDIEELQPALGRLAEVLRSLHNATHQPLEQSVRGGTQTDGILFRRIEPEIQKLRAAIVRTVERYIAELPPFDASHPFLGLAREGPVRFAGSWSVRLPRQGHHSSHIHPAGWISSALYISLPDDAERGPPPAGWLQFGAQSELKLDLEPTRMVEPKPGRLVLFPSTMWHGTVPFEEGERLSVAFDVARPRR